MPISDNARQIQEAREAYDGLGSEIGAALNSIQAAITMIDLAANANASSATMTRIAFGAKGGMVAGTRNLDRHDAIRQTLGNTRSLLSTARLELERTQPLIEANIRSANEKLRELGA